MAQGLGKPEFLGLAAKTVDRDRRERGFKGLFGRYNGGTYYLRDQRRRFLFRLWVGCLREPCDFGDGDAPALAGQFIAAARTPHALQDTGVNERLQQRFEMTRRQSVPL